MVRFVGLGVSQKLTSICVVDDAGRRLWRGQCHSEPDPIERTVRRHAWYDASIGIETGPMTPRLAHELRGLNVVYLDGRQASAALKMQMNKTDQDDAKGLAQIMCTGWYRSVHVKSPDTHRTRALLGAREQLVGLTTRLSNHIWGAQDVRDAAWMAKIFDGHPDVLYRHEPDELTVPDPGLDPAEQVRRWLRQRWAACRSQAS
jgi:transposase